MAVSQRPRFVARLYYTSLDGSRAIANGRSATKREYAENAASQLRAAMALNRSPYFHDVDVARLDELAPAGWRQVPFFDEAASSTMTAMPPNASKHMRTVVDRLAEAFPNWVSGPDLRRATGQSEQAFGQTLKPLRDHGVIESRPAGRRLEHRLVRRP